MNSIRGYIFTAVHLPARKIIGGAMMAIGIPILVVALSPLLLLLVYPLAAATLATAAVATLLLAPRFAWISRAKEYSARALLITAAIAAALFIALHVSVLVHTGGHDFLNISGWLLMGAILVPQCLWFSRFRANPWAVLTIALISLVPYVVALKDFDFE